MVVGKTRALRYVFCVVLQDWICAYWTLAALVYLIEQIRDSVFIL